MRPSVISSISSHLAPVDCLATPLPALSRHYF